MAANNGDLNAIQSTKDWDEVREHLGSLFAMKKFPPNEVRKALKELIAATKAEKLAPDAGMVEVLQSWRE